MTVSYFDKKTTQNLSKSVTLLSLGQKRGKEKILLDHACVHLGYL